MNILLLNWLFCLFTLLLGPLLHFVRKITNNKIALIFGATNESTWEHLKLLFWPMAISFLPEYLIYGNRIPCFIQARVISILLGILFIICFFYTYTGILGKNLLPVDIATFILGTLSAYLYSQNAYLYTPTPYCSVTNNLLHLSLFFALVFAFVLFTFRPPKIGLFYDYSQNKYGV